MAASRWSLQHLVHKGLASCAGILAFKIGALNLLTVRSRLLTGDMASGKEEASPSLQTTSDEQHVRVLLQGLAVRVRADVQDSGERHRPPRARSCTREHAQHAQLPPLHEHTQKLVQLVNNAKENEPWFLAVATAVALASWPFLGRFCHLPYCASRFAHAALFVAEFPKELLPYQVLMRAMRYLTGVFTMFRLAGTAMPPCAGEEEEPPSTARSWPCVAVWLRG